MRLSFGGKKGVPDLAFRSLVKEPLMVVLPGDHRLASLQAISPKGSCGARPS